MPSNIDTSFLTVAGPVGKSTQVDGEPGFNEAVVIPAKDEIDGLMAGTLIDMSGLTTDETPGPDDLVLVRTTDVTYATTVRALTASGNTIPILSKEDLGIPGDGVGYMDEAFGLAMSTWSTAGGAIFLLRPDDGANFKIRDRLTGLSSVAVQFVGPDILCDKDGGYRIQGELAELPETGKPRLLADATAGETVIEIDMAPDGGGALSTRFAVGDYIVIRGLSDGSGAAIERQEVKVTGVNDGDHELTLADPLEFDFKIVYPAGDYEANFGIVDRSYIAVQSTVALTGNAAAGATVLACSSTQIGRLAVGDHVILLTDSETSSGNLDEIEIARIVDIGGDGANTVTLNRRIERAYATADSARLLKFNPATGAALAGASFVHTEAPDASPAPRRHAVEVAYASGCLVQACRAPNTDAFGFRGQTVRFYRSYDSKAVDCFGANPKHTGSGDGYIFAAYSSTLCDFINCMADGGRHNYLFQASTLCNTRGCTGLNALVSDHDFHGCGEAACWGYDPTIIGGSKAVGATRTAVTHGNTTHFTGSHRCGIKGGSIRRYSGSGAAVMRAHPPSTEYGLVGVAIDDIETLFYHSDLSGAGTLVAERGYIEECSVSGCAGKVVDADGGRNGSAVRTLKDFTIRDLRLSQVGSMLHFTQADGVRIIDLVADKISSDVSAPYVVNATDVLGLCVHRLFATAAARGIAVTDCPDFMVTRSDFHQLLDSVILLDGGGCDGGQWRYVDAGGDAVTRSGSSSSITEYPLPIDGSEDFITG